VSRLNPYLTALVKSIAKTTVLNVGEPASCNKNGPAKENDLESDSVIPFIFWILEQKREVHVYWSRKKQRTVAR